MTPDPYSGLPCSQGELGSPAQQLETELSDEVGEVVQKGWEEKSSGDGAEVSKNKRTGKGEDEAPEQGPEEASSSFEGEKHRERVGHGEEDGLGERPYEPVPLPTPDAVGHQEEKTAKERFLVEDASDLIGQPTNEGSGKGPSRNRPGKEHAHGKKVEREIKAKPVGGERGSPLWGEEGNGKGGNEQGRQKVIELYLAIPTEPSPKEEQEGGGYEGRLDQKRRVHGPPSASS